MTLNFNDIWRQIYDTPLYDIERITADLNKTSTIVEDTKAWFRAFFGAEGVVTLNVITHEEHAEEDTEEGEVVGTHEESGNYTIPAGMEEIVAWVRK